MVKQMELKLVEWMAVMKAIQREYQKVAQWVDYLVVELEIWWVELWVCRMAARSD